MIVQYLIEGNKVYVTLFDQLNLPLILSNDMYSPVMSKRQAVCDESRLSVGAESSVRVKI